MSNLEKIKESLKTTILPEREQQIFIDEISKMYNIEELTEKEMEDILHKIKKLNFCKEIGKIFA